MKSIDRKIFHLAGKSFWNYNKFIYMIFKDCLPIRWNWSSEYSIFELIYSIRLDHDM